MSAKEKLELTTKKQKINSKTWKVDVLDAALE